MTAVALPPAETFWRTADPILDSSGRVVRGGMWEHQREWRALPNFIRGLVTGYGGGKTIALAKDMIELALINAPVPVITVSPTYPMAQTTVVQTIDELLAGKARLEPGLRYRLFRSQPFRFDIRFRGRVATILCMSGEKPDRLKGSNVAAAGIDEPFMMARAVFDQVLARVRHPMAKRRRINITGTPEGVVGWGYDLFEGELRRRLDVGLVQRSSMANRALPPGYIDNLLASFDEQSRAAYVEGRFVNLSQGRVYHSFDPTTHVVDAEMPKDAEVAVGMDFNVDPMAFVYFWRSGERMHVFAEREMRNADAEQAGIEIRASESRVRNVYPDASGAQRHAGGNDSKSAFAYLKQLGFTICARPSNPLLVDRRNAVNAAFRRGRVTIGRDCQKLRNYLLAYTHEGANKAHQKAMGHLLDAFSYPIAYLFPVDRQALRLVTWR